MASRQLSAHRRELRQKSPNRVPMSDGNELLSAKQVAGRLHVSEARVLVHASGPYNPIAIQ